ncbi:MAG: outer membrane lipoprotein carrier protein LolA [Deltaproteobacteria bacterium]|jgi:outer membrane lipoprotein carrier protein|nr:outer membrane lipoprotein carrier protein LolA [Deltaproteobacteria bacterium]
MFFAFAQRSFLAVVVLSAAFALCSPEAKSATPAQSSESSEQRSPAEWSDAVQKRYAQLDNMHVLFEQKITHGESGITEERQGEIHFRKPFLVRWITRPPAEEVLVVTDKLIWQYLPDEELAYKFPIEAVDDKNAFLRVLFGMSSLSSSFEITVLSDKDVPGKPDAEAGQGEADALVCLQLDPFEPSTSLMQAIIWVEPDSATLRRLQITDFYGNVSEMSVTSLEVNVKIPDSTFEFSPPPGTEIEDQTQLPDGL